MRGTAEVEPTDNRLFVLVLQHPQEKREVLATPTATCAALPRAPRPRGSPYTPPTRPAPPPAAPGAPAGATTPPPPPPQSAPAAFPRATSCGVCGRGRPERRRGLCGGPGATRGGGGGRGRPRGNRRPPGGGPRARVGPWRARRRPPPAAGRRRLPLRSPAPPAS